MKPFVGFVDLDVANRKADKLPSADVIPLEDGTYAIASQGKVYGKGGTTAPISRLRPVRGWRAYRVGQQLYGSRSRRGNRRHRRGLSGSGSNAKNWLIVLGGGAALLFLLTLPKN